MASQPLERRVFGKVDEYGGELAASTFLRIWFLPLLPTGSVWISSADACAMARPIRWHWRSIAAAYLRTWVPLVWFFGFVDDSNAGYAASGVALALYAWSWTWRMAHRRRDQLRSDFDLVALGSQCPPARLPREESKALLAHKQAELAAIAGDRTPEDIARFGSAEVDELIAAYAVLRLVAAQRRPSGPWRIAAQRIIDGRHDEPGEGDGVFRTTSAGARLTADQLARQIHARARQLRARSIIEADRIYKTLLQSLLWGSTLRWLGYAALVLVAVKGASMVQNINDPDQFEIITARHLRDTIASGKTEYRVQCESLIPFVSAEDSGRDADVHLCALGGKVLPVLSEDGEGIRGTLVRGRLLPRHVFRHDAPQWEELLQASRYDDKAAVVYLLTDVFSKTGQLVLAISYLLGSILLLGIWQRLRGQRARMLEEARAEMSAARGGAPTA